MNPVSKHTKISKEGLINVLNGAIDEVNQIHDLYNRFFTSEGEAPSYLKQIEDKLESISAAYATLFDETAPSKTEIAKSAVTEIKAYHDELLLGDKSIKADIKDSQVKITNFYNKLFSSSDGVTQDGGQRATVDAAIKSITDFDSLLNQAVTGHRAKIEKAKLEILEAHATLFDKDPRSNKSKFELLNEQIAKTYEYHDQVKNKILPYITEKQKEINLVSDDIKNKRSEVDSLLSNATVRTLAQGYMEARQIYGSPVFGEYPKKKKGQWLRTKYVISALARYSKHFLKFLGGYILFIGPLVVIGILFVTNTKEILGVDATGNVKFSGTEYIFYKLTIALPLLWVSWYGQRSLSHRKRLFEEYNHKLRVVQMYMLFTAQENTYALEDATRRKLEDTLLDTIERNPSSVYGKDETLIDKWIDVLAQKKSNQSNDSDSTPRAE